MAKVLLDYGNRVQFSVFEVKLTEKILEIKERTSQLIERKKDNISYYIICKGCEDKKSVLGIEKRKKLTLKILNNWCHKNIRNNIRFVHCVPNRRNLQKGSKKG